MNDNETRRAADTARDDTRDTLDEVKHRAQAGGEKVKRAVQGDAMPAGDRVASHVKEAGHNLKAEFDATKRDVRHADERT